MELLERLIPSPVYQKLLEANIDSLKIIILMNNTELQELAKVNYTEAKLILENTADLLVRYKTKCVLNVAEWNRISTGCKSIDEICNGGIPANGINEIYGCSGVGKTQLALQLSIMVQFDKSIGGFSKVWIVCIYNSIRSPQMMIKLTNDKNLTRAVYICTEDVFPSKRLHSLAIELQSKFNNGKLINLEDNVFIEHAVNYEELRRLLFVRLPHLIERISIGLIVLDSIAGVFRNENASVNYTTRSEEIFSIASKLKELSKKYNLVTVCINQVTDDITTSQTVPSLGYGWANLVTCRYEISRVHSESKLRIFEVINCPDLPPNRCNFLITPAGLS